jgi:hypothetical protein
MGGRPQCPFAQNSSITVGEHRHRTTCPDYLANCSHRVARFLDLHSTSAKLLFRFIAYLRHQGLFSHLTTRVRELHDTNTSASP